MSAAQTRELIDVVVMISTGGKRMRDLLAIIPMLRFVLLPASSKLPTVEFLRDVRAIGEMNRPQRVYAEVDMELLAHLSDTGGVQTCNHWWEATGNHCAATC